jgi:hypothetical protein
MTFFHRRGSENQGVVLPIIVGLTLVFSAITLLDSNVHGQNVATTSAAPASPVSDAVWLKGIGTVVSAVAGPGFAVWYAYHMTTKRIPEVEKGHKETIDRMQADHTAEVKGLIADFRADIKTLWDIKRADDAELRDVLKDLSRQTRNGTT